MLKSIGAVPYGYEYSVIISARVSAAHHHHVTGSRPASAAPRSAVSYHGAVRYSTEQFAGRTRTRTRKCFTPKSQRSVTLLVLVLVAFPCCYSTRTRTVPLCMSLPLLLPYSLLGFQAYCSRACPVLLARPTRRASLYTAARLHGRLSLLLVQHRALWSLLSPHVWSLHVSEQVIVEWPLHGPLYSFYEYCIQATSTASTSASTASTAPSAKLVDDITSLITLHPS